MPCTVSIMQYFNHMLIYIYIYIYIYILIIALKYGEIFIKTISAQYLFNKKKLCELSVMLDHWTILLKCLVN